MNDPAKHFEIVILRPLQIVFLVSAAVFLLTGMWLWLAGCAVAVLYLGIVGSKLHPFQSASESHGKGFKVPQPALNQS